jgi:hypothetical protein
VSEERHVAETYTSVFKWGSVKELMRRKVKGDWWYTRRRTGARTGIAAGMEGRRIQRGQGIHSIGEL